MCRFVRACALSIVVLLSLPPIEASAAQEHRAKESRETAAAGGESQRADERQTSDWGELVNGLQMRASCPKRIEQGEELTCDVEFQCDVSELLPGIKAFNPCYATCTYFRLLLTNLETEELIGIDGETRTYGPFGGDDGRFAQPLDGSPIKPFHPRFVTIIDETPMPTGRYRALLRYRQPNEPSPVWRRSKEDWLSGGFWSGNIQAGRLEIEIAPAIERTRTIYVPSRVRLLKFIRPAFPSQQPSPRVEPAFRYTVTYLFEDAQPLIIPLRNGHWVGHTIESSDGTRGLSGGPPMPGDLNGLDQLYRYQNRGGDADYTLTVTVFETCADNPRFVGPGSCGYKVLWEKSFSVKYTAEEMAAALEFPWYGPP